MPHHVTDQLNRLMSENNTSASALALGTGISNATISKMRSENFTGSPSFEVIQKICDYFQVPLETFSRKNDKRTNFIQMNFRDFALQSGADTYNKFMKKCLNRETIYISNTIPDALKTEAVLKAETGDRDFIETYAKSMKSIRENESVIKCLFGSFFIDTQILSALISRKGKYQSLTDEEVCKQIEILEEFFQKSFPRVHGYVLDYKENDLSTAFVVDKEFGAQFSYGGYLEWRSVFLGTIIHRKAVNAINNAENISNYLEKQKKVKGYS